MKSKFKKICSIVLSVFLISTTVPSYAVVASTVAKLPNIRIFNVGDYGAVGDGSNDDTTAIQAAITAASTAGGGVVNFGDGRTYMVSIGSGLKYGVNFSADNTLYTGKSVIKLAQGDWGQQNVEHPIPRVVEVGCDNCVVDNLTVDGGTTINNSIMSGNGLWSTGYSITNITQANPGVISAEGIASAPALTSGQRIYLSGISGMTELNGFIGDIRSVTAGTPDTCRIRLNGSTADVNTSSYGAYTSGGTLYFVHPIYGMLVKGENVTVQNCTFQNTSGDNISFYYTAYNFKAINVVAKNSVNHGFVTASKLQYMKNIWVENYYAKGWVPGCGVTTSELTEEEGLSPNYGLGADGFYQDCVAYAEGINVLDVNSSNRNIAHAAGISDSGGELNCGITSVDQNTWYTPSMVMVTVGTCSNAQIDNIQIGETVGIEGFTGDPEHSYNGYRNVISKDEVNNRITLDHLYVGNDTSGTLGFDRWRKMQKLVVRDSNFRLGKSLPGGTGSSTTTVFKTHNVEDTYIENCKFTAISNDVGQGTVAYNFGPRSRRLTIKNCIFEGGPMNFIANNVTTQPRGGYSMPDEVYIQGNTFYLDGYVEPGGYDGNAINQAAARRLTIEDNQAHVVHLGWPDTASNASFINWDFDDNDSTGNSNYDSVVIRNNTIYANVGSSHRFSLVGLADTATMAKESGRWKVYNNKIYDLGGAAEVLNLYDNSNTRRGKEIMLNTTDESGKRFFAKTVDFNNAFLDGTPDTTSYFFSGDLIYMVDAPQNTPVAYYVTREGTPTSDNVAPIFMGDGNMNNTSGDEAFLTLSPRIKQSGTAGYRGILLDVTEQSTGSGSKALFNFRVGGADRMSGDNAGVMHLRAGTSTDSFNADGILAVSTDAVGNVSTGEDNLKIIRIHPDVLGTNNDSIWFESSGTLAASANNKRVRVRFGTSGTNTVFDSGVIVSTLSTDWAIKGRIFRKGASAQKAEATFVTSGGVMSADVQTALNQTLSSTQNLYVTGEGTSDSDIVAETLVVGFGPQNS